MNGGQAGPGVIFFDTASSELCELVQSTSRGGGERVIAIGSEPESLGDGPSWRVIGAGASDVIAWGDTRRCAEHGRAARALARRRRASVSASPSWARRRERGVALGAAPDRRGGPVHRRAGADHGRERHRQGARRRAIHVLDRAARQADLVVVDCAAIVPDAVRERALRSRARRVHRRDRARDGAFELRRRRHAVPRRDRRAAARAPGEAAARRSRRASYKRVGGNADAARSTSASSRATNRDLLERGRRRAASARTSTTASTCVAIDAAAAARAPRGHPAARRSTSCRSCGARTAARPTLDRRRARAADSRYDWPGNVRELRQLVARMSHRHVGPGPITLGDVPEEERPSHECRERWRPTPLEERSGGRWPAARRSGTSGGVAARRRHRVALDDEGGNVQRAAAAWVSPTRAFSCAGPPPRARARALHGDARRRGNGSAVAVGTERRVPDAGTGAAGDAVRTRRRGGARAPATSRSRLPPARAARRSAGGRAAGPSPAPRRDEARDRRSRTGSCWRPARARRPPRAGRTGARPRCRCRRWGGARAGRSTRAGRASRRRSSRGAG